MSIKLNIAGLMLDFNTQYPEYVRQRCSKYLAPGSAVCDLSLSASPENLAKSAIEGVSIMEAELFAMTIPLGEQLPLFDRIMTHGVAISYNGMAYIFTAASGVGKSTHAFLWQRYFGADTVHVINGDKPILWFKDDTVLACGSPWSGKENLDENAAAPIGGICLLCRLEGSQYNSPCIVRANEGETLEFLLQQIYLPSKLENRLKTFTLLERLYQSVPVYRLYADMSKQSVEVCARCLAKSGGA